MALSRLHLILILVGAVLGTPAAAAPHSTQGRQSLALDDLWRFLRADAAGAESSQIDDSSWEWVTLPHTYNAKDGELGGPYYRGTVWYRRALLLTKYDATRRYFLQFDGAALVTDVWVNDRHAGRHEGGYAGFRFDVGNLLHKGRNVIAVRVDNSQLRSIAPLGGDFTVFGGLYRSVRLLSTDALHIDLLDHGGPGVYAAATNISEDRASLRLTTGVVNNGSERARTQVCFGLRDLRDRLLKRLCRTVSIAAGQVLPVEQLTRLRHPHRWDGTRDPYLYSVTAEIVNLSLPGSPITDAASVPLGIRSIAVDAERGFLLNDRPYSVHGVNLFHSGRPGKGLAVSEADVDEDFRILDELGVTGLRLVHFQHPQRAYDNADRAGLILWSEIPLNSWMEDSAAFRANICEQLRELIKQNYNHPAVAVWGLGNEIYQSDDASHRLLAQLQRIAHEEDPLRPTSYAHCCAADDDAQATQTDLSAYNRYYGWYDGEMTDIGTWADRLHGRMPRAIAISEYGAGASTLQQQDPPVRPVPKSHWHPEQYQALFHETYWRMLRTRPFLWATFVWVGFDLASAGRDEGDRAGINDKGLVSYDRATRKDAFYWYQANWSGQPMVHVTSPRATPRSSLSADIKVYSNTAHVSLNVNDIAFQSVEPVDHIAVWKDVPLREGSNRIIASSDDRSSVDAVEWTVSARAGHRARNDLP
jgi:beta-galactosidase/beta-glucuronidase